MIEAANRIQERHEQEYMIKLRNDIAIKDAAIQVYLNNLGCMIYGDANSKYASLSERFAVFFGDTLQDSGSLSAEMKLYKAQRLDHARRHNARRKEGQDGRGTHP